MPATRFQPLNLSFWAVIKNSLFGKHLDTGQRLGIEAIYYEWQRRMLTNKKVLAYILASVYHETSRKMQPIEERGKGAGKPYGHKLKFEKDASGNNVPYTIPDKLYYGRGLIQLTWYENYDKFGVLLGQDLLNKPELALRQDIAVQIMFEGMLKGLFTTKGLNSYLDNNRENWVGARMVINGLDRATDIALIAQKFYKALINSDSSDSPYQLYPKKYA